MWKKLDFFIRSLGYRADPPMSYRMSRLITKRDIESARLAAIQEQIEQHNEEVVRLSRLEFQTSVRIVDINNRIKELNDESR